MNWVLGGLSMAIDGRFDTSRLLRFGFFQDPEGY
jgi:hypothetical protein